MINFPLTDIQVSANHHKIRNPAIPARLYDLPQDDLLTPDQAATEAEVTRTTIYNWLGREQGPLRSARKGRWHKIRRRDLRRFLESQDYRKGDGALSAAAPTAPDVDEFRQHARSLLEIALCALYWKRAGMMVRAACEGMDLEYLETATNSQRECSERLHVALGSITEQELLDLQRLLGDAEREGSNDNSAELVLKLARPL